MNLRVARLVGDPIARGRAHGAAFAEPIRRYAAERVHLATNGSWAGRPVSTADVLGLAEQMVPAHRDYAPDVFAEMVAMADAAGISVPEAIIVGGFTDFVDAVRGAAAADRAEDDCTAVIVPDGRAEAGHGWLAQTWDMHDTATEHVVVLEIAPEGGPAATVFTTVGCVAQIGMNAHGVAVGINNLTANDGRVGVTWPFVVRRMLAESTADAAIACVTEAPLAGGHDYLVLDAHGAGANLEAMPTHTAVTPLRADVLAHTNHALDPETLRRQAARPPGLQQSSIDRLDRALSRTREGVLTRQALFDLTADPVICRDSEAPFHMETSGAVAMCPRTRELWAVWRSPARHTWQRFVVGGAGASR